MIDYEFLRKLNISALKRLDLSVSVRFEDAIPYIEILVKSFLSFESNKSVLMGTDRQTINQFFNDFKACVEGIQIFQSDPNESSQDTTKRRNHLIQAVKNVYVAFTNNVLPIYLRVKAEEDGKNFQAKMDNFAKIIVNSEKLINTTINTFESNFTNAQNNFNNISNQSKVDFDNIIQEAKKELNEAHQIKNEAKNLAVEKLVKKYGSIFSNQASNNLKDARKSFQLFMITLISIILLTLYFFIPLLGRIEKMQKLNNVVATTTSQVVSRSSSMNSINELQNPITIEYLIIYIISRLTILGLASIFLRETLKNYNINMHLHTINLHRQHSLESFDMLVANASSKETRDLIITELAQAIYTNQEDGYLSNSDKKTISIAQVTELIKALK